MSSQQSRCSYISQDVHTTVGDVHTTVCVVHMAVCDVHTTVYVVHMAVSDVHPKQSLFATLVSFATSQDRHDQEMT